MAIELLTERHGDQIAGVLGCWDRMLIFGTLPKICFAGGMTSFLFERNIRIFDYPRFAEPFRNRIRENAEKLAADTAQPISLGTTNKPARRIWFPMMANAFITISISSTRNWAYVTCASRHGYPAGCRSTSMATTGWPVSCVSRVSNIGSSTTPLSK